MYNTIVNLLVDITQKLENLDKKIDNAEIVKL